MGLLVNGILDVASLRWLAPWSGVWSAELELTSDVIPTGRVTITSTEGLLLSGTVDPDRSGTFGEKRHLRVVGGGAGWGKPVSPQDYHSDVGVQLLEVATTTGTAAGEVVSVLLPLVLGVHFVRRGPPETAAQIFADAGVDWWVGTDGVTRVGVRPQLPAPSSLDLVNVDMVTGVATFTCDDLVEPGAVIVDDRFGNVPRIVREVDASMTGSSVTGTLWLVESQPKAGFVTELAEHLAAIARSATRSAFGRLYEYRVIAMEGDRVELQAVKPADGVPDVLPASVWAGASGYRATLRPSSRVLVGFVAADPRQPFVAFYEPPEADGWRPVQLELDAVTKLSLGAQALAVVLGVDEGALPIARAPAVIAFAEAVAAALTAAGSSQAALGAVPVTSAALGAVLSGLGTAIEAAATALGTACPSAKVVAS